MPDYRLVTFQTSDGSRAGALIGEQIYDAAKLTGNPAHATMLAVLRGFSYTTEFETFFRGEVRRFAELMGATGIRAK